MVRIGGRDEWGCGGYIFGISVVGGIRFGKRMVPIIDCNRRGMIVIGMGFVLKNRGNEWCLRA